MKSSAKLRRVEFSYAALSENYDRILSTLQVDDGVNMTYIDETRGVIGLAWHPCQRSNPSKHGSAYSVYPQAW